MKQVYTYSQKQFDERMQSCNFLSEQPHLNYINDKPFTQQQSIEGDEEIDLSKINNCNDNKIVHVSENLPINEFYLKNYNRRKADTSLENTKHVRI